MVHGRVRADPQRRHPGPLHLDVVEASKEWKTGGTATPKTTSGQLVEVEELGGAVIVVNEDGRVTIEQWAGEHAPTNG